MDQIGHEKLLATYIEAWIIDIADNLRGYTNPLIGRRYAQNSVARAVAGHAGLYDDILVRAAANLLGQNIDEFWALLFYRGVCKARKFSFTGEDS